MTGSQGRGRNNSLSTHVVNYLKAWLDEHINHPYPSEAEKAQMVADTGIELKRLNNWVSFQSRLDINIESCFIRLFSQVSFFVV